MSARVTCDSRLKDQLINQMESGGNPAALELKPALMPAL